MQITAQWCWKTGLTSLWLRCLKTLSNTIYQLFLCIHKLHITDHNLKIFCWRESKMQSLFDWLHLNTALISCFEQNISAYKTGWEGTSVFKRPKTQQHRCNHKGKIQTKRPAELGINRKWDKYNKTERNLRQCYKQKGQNLPVLYFFLSYFVIFVSHFIEHQMLASFIVQVI